MFKYGAVALLTTALALLLIRATSELASTEERLKTTERMLTMEQERTLNLESELATKTKELRILKTSRRVTEVRPDGTKIVTEEKVEERAKVFEETADKTTVSGEERTAEVVVAKDAEVVVGRAGWSLGVAYGGRVVELPTGYVDPRNYEVTVYRRLPLFEDFHVGVGVRGEGSVSLGVRYEFGR